VKIIRRRLASGEVKEYRYPRDHKPRARKPFDPDKWNHVPNWTFANMVRDARQLVGMSKRQVAELMSVEIDVSYITHIERHGYTPTVAIVDALAGVLDASLDVFRFAAGYAPATFHGWDAERIGDCIYGTLEDVAQGLRPELLEALSAIAACGPETQREGAGVISNLVAVMQERRQQRAS